MSNDKRPARGRARKQDTDTSVTALNTVDVVIEQDTPDPVDEFTETLGSVLLPPEDAKVNMEAAYAAIHRNDKMAALRSMDIVRDLLSLVGHNERAQFIAFACRALSRDSQEEGRMSPYNQFLADWFYAYAHDVTSDSATADGIKAKGTPQLVGDKANLKKHVANTRRKFEEAAVVVGYVFHAFQQGWKRVNVLDFDYQGTRATGNMQFIRDLSGVIGYGGITQWAAHARLMFTKAGLMHKVTRNTQPQKRPLTKEEMDKALPRISRVDLALFLANNIMKARTELSNWKPTRSEQDALLGLFSEIEATFGGVIKIRELQHGTDTDDSAEVRDEHAPTPQNNGMGAAA